MVGRQARGRRAGRAPVRLLRTVLVVVLTLFLFTALAVPSMFAFAGGPLVGSPDSTTTGVVAAEAVGEIAQRTGIPQDAVAAYVSAANAYPVDWTILAGIGERECDHGRSQLTGCPRGTANFCGARGPMQFLGNIWRRGTDRVTVGDCPGASHFTGDPIGPPIPEGREGQGFATDGNGDGVADPWEWLDATHAAARYLIENGLRDDVRRAIRSYNNSTSYVNGVMANARRYREATAGIDLTASGDAASGGGGRGAGGAPGGCPVEPRGPTEPHVDRGNTRTTQAMADAVVGCFGHEYDVYCEGARATGEHPRGRACDFMVTSGGMPDPTRRAHGEAMAEWIAENAADLNILYVIWYDRIWNPSVDPLRVAGSWEDWPRDYSGGCGGGRGDPSGCHYNHVHVSVRLMTGDPPSANCGGRDSCWNTNG